MTSVTLPQLRGSALLTHSRMSCLASCQRKHHFRYELGIRPARSATPLRMGSAVHIGLDARAQGKSPEESVAVATAGYEALPPWANDDEKIGDWLCEREVVARILMGYFWYWEQSQAAPNLTVADVLETERSFDIPIVNPETGKATPTFRFAGKRDKVVRLGDGRVAVMEHKTCSEDLSPTSDYWVRLRIDSQISGYVVAAREDGHDVQTVLYDVIRKPSIRPYKATPPDQRKYTKDGKLYASQREKGETPAEYGERLNEDIAARPEFYFARQEIPRLEADLAEFRAELWDKQQSIREGQRRGWSFRNTSACLVFGRCEYLDHCLTGLDPTNPPAGFEVVDDIHPELQEADI